MYHEELAISAEQCELCHVMSTTLEENELKKSAEEYKATINDEYVLVNDTSITISVNKHQLPKSDQTVRAPIDWL
ncbi:MAG: hypothetical protein MMC23_005100 [Stictis urceolatum]|nr:hypothetical protein [Stictis urceolata]